MGNVLVVLQFGLLGVLASLAVPQLARGWVDGGFIGLAGASLALAVWTLVYNRPGNFNIRPAPKSGGRLITSGPYRWIRHPMYTAVLLGAGALAWVLGSLTGYSAWLALALVLLVKAIVEERWLTQKHPEYAAYTLQSKRFVPWLI